MDELLTIVFKFLFRLIMFIPEMIWELVVHFVEEITLNKLQEDYPNLLIFLFVLILSGVISVFIYFVQ